MKKLLLLLLLTFSISSCHVFDCDNKRRKTKKYCNKKKSHCGKRHHKCYTCKTKKIKAKARHLGGKAKAPLKDIKE